MKNVLEYRPHVPLTNRERWSIVAQILALFFAPIVAAFLCALGSIFGLWQGAAAPLVIAALTGWYLARPRRSKSVRWIAGLSLLATLLPLVLTEPSILSYERRINRHAYETAIRARIVELRGALIEFTGSHNGAYPSNLALLASNGIGRNDKGLSFAINQTCPDGTPAYRYVGNGLFFAQEEDSTLVICRVRIDGKVLVCSRNQRSLELTTAELETRLTAENELRRIAKLPLIDVPEVLHSLQ